MRRHWLENWRENWSVRRVLFTAGVAATIATAVALSLSWWAAVVLAALLLASFLIPRFRRPFWLVCGVTAVVFLLATVAYREVNIRPLSALSGKQDTLTGQVVATPVNGSMYTLRVTDSSCVPTGTRVALYCPSELAPTLYDTVTAQVELLSADKAAFHLSDTETHLYAFLVKADEDHIRATNPEDFSFLEWLAPLRRQLQDALCRVLPGEEGVLLTALCLGIRRELTGDIASVFRDSGLTHLLVVSGLHLTLVAVTLRRLFRGLRLGYRLSAILTAPVVLLFMWLVGFTPSVCRAGVMCLVWLSGFLVCRRPDGLNSLGLAAILVLLANPYTLYNAGFQLSFLATAGILLVAPRLMRHYPPMTYSESVAYFVGYRLGQYVTGLMAACLGAWLFTIPLSCYYFGGFSLLLPLANLLVVAVAGWALLWGWLGMLFCLWAPLDFLGKPILYGAGLLARYLYWSADVFGPKWAFVRISDLWQYLLMVTVCVLLAVGIRWCLSWRRIAVACLTITVLSVAVCYPLTASVTRLTVVKTDSGAALLVHKGAHATLLVTDGDDLKDVTYTVGQTPLDAVVVGAGAPSNAATLTALAEDTGNPTLYTADARQWEAFSDLALTRLDANEPLAVEPDCQITRLDGGWWLVETVGGSVLLGAGEALPQEADLVVYTAIPTTFANAPCVLACDEEQLAQQRPQLNEKTYWLSADSVTYITRPGKKWSVSPWL